MCEKKGSNNAAKTNEFSPETSHLFIGRLVPSKMLLLIRGIHPPCSQPCFSMFFCIPCWAPKNPTPATSNLFQHWIPNVHRETCGRVWCCQAPILQHLCCFLGRLSWGKREGTPRWPIFARVLFRKQVSVKGAARVPPVPGREAGKEKEQ